MGKTHEVAVSLRRDSPTEQWGFSLVGGADVQTPLIVTRVSAKVTPDFAAATPVAVFDFTVFLPD
jgi:hypothetical protein